MLTAYVLIVALLLVVALLLIIVSQRGSTARTIASSLIGAAIGVAIAYPICLVLGVHA